MRRIETVEVRCQYQDQASGKLSPEPGWFWLAHWHHWQHTAWCKLGFPPAHFPFTDGCSLLSWALNQVDHNLGGH